MRSQSWANWIGSAASPIRINQAARVWRGTAPPAPPEPASREDDSAQTDQQEDLEAGEGGERQGNAGPGIAGPCSGHRQASQQATHERPDDRVAEGHIRDAGPANR